MPSLQKVIDAIDMIDKQHLDIRTITMGISLLDCASEDVGRCCEKIYDKICHKAENLVQTGESIEREFAGKGYGDFKQAVGEAVAEHLAPVRENYAKFVADKGYLEECYKRGAEQAERIANRTLEKMYKKVGFVAR